MAPFTATFASAALELSAILAARQTTNEPGDKSPALFAEQGRYAYTPSFAAAVAFLVLFGILTITNIWLFFRHRSWFWWSMNLAVLMEFVGYIARAISIKNLDKKNIFIVQVVLLLVAPAVYAAACYQAFGRIVLWIVPPQYQTAKHLWLPSRYITPLFVGFDVFAFVSIPISSAAFLSVECKHVVRKDEFRDGVSLAMSSNECKLTAHHSSSKSSVEPSQPAQTHPRNKPRAKTLSSSA